MLYHITGQSHWYIHNIHEVHPSRLKIIFWTWSQQRLILNAWTYCITPSPRIIFVESTQKRNKWSHVLFVKRNLPGDFLDVKQQHPIFPNILCHPKLWLLLGQPRMKKNFILVLGNPPNHGTQLTWNITPDFQWWEKTMTVRFVMTALPQCFRTREQGQILFVHLLQNARQPNKKWCTLQIKEYLAMTSKNL